MSLSILEHDFQGLLVFIPYQNKQINLSNLLWPNILIVKYPRFYKLCSYNMFSKQTFQCIFPIICQILLGQIMCTFSDFQYFCQIASPKTVSTRIMYKHVSSNLYCLNLNYSFVFNPEFLRTISGSLKSCCVYTDGELSLNFKNNSEPGSTTFSVHNLKILQRQTATGYKEKVKCHRQQHQVFIL